MPLCEVSKQYCSERLCPVIPVVIAAPCAVRPEQMERGGLMSMFTGRSHG